MATILMTEKYGADIYGVLNCYDRVVISGHLHPLCYAKGMTKYLYTHEYDIVSKASREARRGTLSLASSGGMPYRTHQLVVSRED